MFERKLLDGAARKFIMSQKNIISWSISKKKLFDEFSYTVNSKEVHDKLRSRKKRPNESCREYLYDMMSIATQIDLENEALIDYVVDGVQDNTMDKLILRGATNIDELKRKLEEYGKVKNKHFNKLNFQSVNTGALKTTTE